MTSLAESQRSAILDRVLTVIDRRFMGADPDTRLLRERHEPSVVRAESRADFEDAMNRMLKDLGASHVGFFHEATPRAAGTDRDCGDIHQGRDGRRFALGVSGCASRRCR